MTHQGEVPKIEFKKLVKAACNRDFTCGERDVDKYFRKHAWDAHDRGSHRVTYSHLPTAEHPIGFYSLASVTEEIGKLPGQYWRFGGGDRFPCLQLVWLGVHRRFHGKKIGTRLVADVIATFAEVGERVGLPHLVLVPISEDVKPFYRELGFTEYDEGRKMFLPLQSAIAAMTG